MFENLGILWFDEETCFELVDSTVDIENNTISSKVNHFSKYMVVDKRHGMQHG